MSHEKRQKQAFDVGMSLRDYFAARAMVAYSHPDYSALQTPESLSAYAYKVADAMLKARALHG